MTAQGRVSRRWVSAGLAWVAATGLGLTLGFGLWELSFPLVRSPLSQALGGSLNAALFGAQWALLRRQTALDARWVAASIAGYSVGLATAAWAAALLTQALGGRVSVALSDGSEVLAYGLLLGAGAGVARALAPGARGGALGRWALLSGTSYAIGYAATYGLSQVAAPAHQPWLGAAFGLCVGILSGALEWLLFSWLSHVLGAAAVAEPLGGKRDA